jgi:hypothetical protein
MFGKYYQSKMQVCLSLEDSIKLVKLFGTDYFTQINVRNNNLDIIKKDIQPSYMQQDRFKLFIKEIKKINKENQSNVQFEFIKK